MDVHGNPVTYRYVDYDGYDEDYAYEEDGEFWEDENGEWWYYGDDGHWWPYYDTGEYDQL